MKWNVFKKLSTNYESSVLAMTSAVVSLFLGWNLGIRLKSFFDMFAVMHPSDKDYGPFNLAGDVYFLNPQCQDSEVSVARASELGLITYNAIIRLTQETWDLLIPINNSYIVYFSRSRSIVTVPISDSSFFAPGFTPSSNANNSPFIPTLPFELVKNWNSGALAFSQVSLWKL